MQKIVSEDEDFEDLIEAIEAAAHMARVISWARISENKIRVRLWGSKFYLITVEEVGPPADPFFADLEEE